MIIHRTIIERNIEMKFKSLRKLHVNAFISIICCTFFLMFKKESVFL